MASKSLLQIVCRNQVVVVDAQDVPVNYCGSAYPCYNGEQPMQQRKKNQAGDDETDLGHGNNEWFDYNGGRKIQ